MMKITTVATGYCFRERGTDMAQLLTVIFRICTTLID
ncbi:hypothetical protein Xbud_03031 [Xenorhabdus budapestensis]|uniref:Uncharacterized protein n=1 Tax=Xenorhabdus budapestensis TaxID=290110 RepID=A0A2D0IU66_XENBU|nr:hypothetical protein Xbud_03031 [Xenorhabdus budapestensis]